MRVPALQFITLWLVFAGSASVSAAAAPSRADAARAAIHPVTSATAMEHWLARVPRTQTFPPDFDATLHGYKRAYVVEMSTAPSCIPCADLWLRLGHLGQRYGWPVRTISGDEAMLRSGWLGLPWIGHPVAWVRPVSDANRIVPVAIGTDHEANLARNLYLAAKMGHPAFRVDSYYKMITGLRRSRCGNRSFAKES